MTCDEMRTLLLTGEPGVDHPHLEHCEACRQISFALRDGWCALDAELHELGRSRPFEEALEQVPVSTRKRRKKMLEIGLYKGLLGLVAAAALLMAVPMTQQADPDSAGVNERTQPAPIPANASVLSRAKHATEVTTAYKWGDLTAADWGLQAVELHDLYQQLEPSIPGAEPEVREVVFHLASQIGRAAENANDVPPPFYQEVSGKKVNYYWYIAGLLGSDELIGSIADQDLRSAVDYYASTPVRCEPGSSDRALVVLPSTAMQGIWSRQVDLVLDSSMVAENLQVTCIFPGEIRLDVSAEEAETLQKQVWAATEVKVRKH